MVAEKVAMEDPVAIYKALLRDLIDRRPSGTRQRIAVALGKHKSFVSQITNPAYAVPVPAKHLATIFELCHFSQDERISFLEAYGRAHPGRDLHAAPSPAESPLTLTIDVPPLKDPRRREELIENIRLYADQAIALAKAWDQNSTVSSKGGKGSEKADKRHR